MPHLLTDSAPITWWQAIILGLVQGLTEFIPVSSSAHLNIVHWIFQQPRQLAFDVVLHIGTAVALLIYFIDDWVQLLTNPAQRKLRNLVLLACVPAAVAGVLVRDLEDKPPFSDVRFNAAMLVLAGAVLWFADHTGRKRRELDSANWKDAVVIGCSQMLAFMPGVSRSGATITAGLARRLTRPAAARFSSLMSLPVTLGAVGFELRHLGHNETAVAGAAAAPALDAPWPVMLLGVAVSGISGYLAIGFLLNYLKTRDVTLFVIWRVAVAALVFILISLQLLPAPSPAP
jgi:undecaprenyl-diphosphatase